MRTRTAEGAQARPVEQAIYQAAYIVYRCVRLLISSILLLFVVREFESRHFSALDRHTRGSPLLRAMASAGLTPNKPRVRTVGFSLHGEAAEEPEVLESAAGTLSAPLPVIIPPAFQVCLHSERLAVHTR